MANVDAERKRDYDILRRAAEMEVQRRNLIEVLFGRIVNLDVMANSRFAGVKFNEEVMLLLEMHKTINSLGEPRIPREIMNEHRRGEFPALVQVTRNAVADYGKSFIVVKQALNMANKEEDRREAIRNVKLAREHITRLLMAEKAFVDAEQKMVTELQKPDTNAAYQRRVA